jgi:hypothetical protein
MEQARKELRLNRYQVNPQDRCSKVWGFRNSVWSPRVEVAWGCEEMPRVFAWALGDEKNESPGTTNEERLCAEARARCRSCTSEPGIPDVVTRDGPELYTRGGPL